MTGLLNRHNLISAYIVFILITIGFAGLMIFESKWEGASVEASTIIVDKSGGGNHTTIQAAIDAAASGDTIRVWAGTYQETISITKTVSIIGNGSQDTIIDGQKAGDVVYIKGDWINLSGLRIFNSAGGFPDYGHGILIESSNYCNISDNNITGNFYSLDISNSNLSKVNNNTITTNSVGPRLMSSNSIHVINNNISSFTLSIGHSNIIEKNNISSNGLRGLIITSCVKYSNNLIINNIFSNNQESDVYLQSTEGIIFKNNNFKERGLYIVGSSLDHWMSNHVDTSNLVNGKPIYFLKNLTSGNIPINAGQVFLINCTNYLIESLTLIKPAVGIQLVNSSYIDVKNNDFNRTSKDAINVRNSHNNTIHNNSMDDCEINIAGVSSNDNNFNYNQINNSISIGISLVLSKRNSVMKNYFSGNSASCVSAFNSYENVFSNNEIYNSFRSFFLKFATKCKIENNTIESSSYNGIYVESSSQLKFLFNIINNSARDGIYFAASHDMIVENNTFSYNKENGVIARSSSSRISVYHNNFISNTKFDDSIEITWCNTNLEGNYWDDYTGVDDGSGFGKHAIAGDGIGDTHIPHHNLDSYPYIHYNGWGSPQKPSLSISENTDFDGSYTLNWSAKGLITGYVLEEDISNSFTFPKEVYSGPKTGFEVNNKNNGSYYYRVKAYNSEFTGLWSDAVMVNVDWVPDVPSGLTVSSYPYGNTLNITWDLNQNDTKSYELYTNITGPWVKIISLFHPVNSYNNTGLTNGKTYYYQIRARDAANQPSYFSTPVSGVPNDIIAPLPPEDQSLNVLSADSIKVSWLSSPTEDVIGYNIYRVKIIDPPSWGEPIAKVSFGQYSYVDSGLNELTTYYYTIAAYDEVPNESELTDVIFGTTEVGQRAPEINNTQEDLQISEDTYDDSSINLYKWFKDINNDKLIFRAKGQDHISVMIYQNNGTVALRPDQDWNGIETITFYANDSRSEISDHISILVTGINDPPGPGVITNPEDGFITNDTTPMDLDGTCEDPDLVYGDELKYLWNSNISGKLGEEQSLKNITLPAGVHKITFEVTDNCGLKSTTEIIVNVEAPEETDVIDDGKDGDDEDPIDDGKKDPQDKKNDTSGKSEGSNTMMLAGLGAAVGIIIALLVLFLILRKKKETPDAKRTGQEPEVFAHVPGTAEQPQEPGSLPAEPAQPQVAPYQPKPVPEVLPEEQQLKEALPQDLPQLPPVAAAKAEPTEVEASDVDSTPAITEPTIDETYLEEASVDTGSDVIYSQVEEEQVWKAKPEEGNGEIEDIDPLAQLEKLGELRGKGLISEEDFQRMKQKLLN